MTNPGLSYRQPEMRWMFISGIAALCLHGLCWFVVRALWGDTDAAGETQRQVTLALFWMVCTLIAWKLSPPPTRLHATLGVLMYALFLTLLGSVVALIKLSFFDHMKLGLDLLKSFSLLSVMMILTHMCLAVPSAILLQAVALKRNMQRNPVAE
jgi:magnesium-transporting ATPase (P-type)